MVSWSYLVGKVKQMTMMMMIDVYLAHNIIVPVIKACVY